MTILRAAQAARVLASIPDADLAEIYREIAAAMRSDSAKPVAPGVWEIRAEGDRHSYRVRFSVQHRTGGLVIEEVSPVRPP